MAFFGAKDGSRTRDLDLGKVALYQLSYFRVPHLFGRGCKCRSGQFYGKKKVKKIYSGPKKEDWIFKE